MFLQVLLLSFAFLIGNNFYNDSIFIYFLSILTFFIIYLGIVYVNMNYDEREYVINVLKKVKKLK